MNTVNLGAILSDRYRVLKKLGEGGFGNTYLAEDINRFNELCVLKEFAPKLEGENAIAKAQTLFQREAGILYQLQHPQIPKFRELFKVKLPDHEYLFLVQDFVEGQNYRSLLRNRQNQGMLFSEAEITQLLLQILPVLHYLHSVGVIHRDISPENMMLRSSDLLPVLIDFGGVKQIEATVESQVLGVSEDTEILTRLGKIGYAPDEQLNRGLVFPHSDLYALAATILVLLTGKEPQQLLNPHTLEWEWEKNVKLSPSMTRILRKMLAKLPVNRFQSAQEILNILQDSPTVPLSATEEQAQQPPYYTAVTKAIAPPPSPSPQTYTPQTESDNTTKSSDWFINSIIILILAGIAGFIGWYVGNNWLNQQNQNNQAPPEPVETVFPETPTEPTETPVNELSPQELQRRQDLFRQRRELGIEYNFYVALVNEFFWQKYPEQQGQKLTDSPQDTPWREKWDAIAQTTLQQLEFLSPNTRQNLGNYTQAQQEQWKQEANQLHLSSSALFDLADAEFLYRFPDQQKIETINQPMGQVWNAIIFDSLQSIKSGQSYEKISFSPNSIGVNKTINIPAGKGKAYVADLQANQLMTLKINSDNNTLLSIYPPSGKQPLLTDSTEKQWTGTLTETGYYEFVIVGNSAESANVNIEFTVEDLTIEQPPAEPEKPVITPVPTPSDAPTPNPENTQENPLENPNNNNQPLSSPNN
jgi:serine/threonine protein kinase, bacterial